MFRTYLAENVQKDRGAHVRDETQLSEDRGSGER